MGLPSGGSHAVRLPLTGDFFDLREVMRAVGDCSDLRWVVRDAWFNGDVSPVWPEGVHQGEQESEEPGGAGLTWSQMSSLAESCHQIIDGRFTGYDDRGRPVLQLQVIDSSYWVVWAEDRTYWPPSGRRSPQQRTTTSRLPRCCAPDSGGYGR